MEDLHRALCILFVISVYRA